MRKKAKRLSKTALDDIHVFIERGRYWLAAASLAASDAGDTGLAKRIDDTLRATSDCIPKGHRLPRGYVIENVT